MNITSIVTQETIIAIEIVILIQAYGVIQNLYTMYPPSKDPIKAEEMLNPPRGKRSKYYVS
jgi:hypothetical protein